MQPPPQPPQWGMFAQMPPPAAQGSGNFAPNIYQTPPPAPGLGQRSEEQSGEMNSSTTSLYPEVAGKTPTILQVIVEWHFYVKLWTSELNRLMNSIMDL